LEAKALGRHVIADLWGVRSNLLNDEFKLRKICVEAAKRSGSTIKGVMFYKFKPHGVTGVLLLAESHLSIHTWPEHGYASVDIYTCGSNTEPWRAFEYIVEALKPSYVEVFEAERGRTDRGDVPPVEGWFVEKYSTYNLHTTGVLKVLYRGESRFQRIEVLDLYMYGRSLIIDGKTQSSERFEWMYHEPLVHPAMVTHPEPSRVLVVGGGEGATAREVLKHGCVDEVHMVDIDAEVVKVCRELLPSMNEGVFEDPRFSLIISDGRRFLENLRDDVKYDVIIVDVTDPAKGSPSCKLYTKEFYEAVYKALSPNGVFVTQAAGVIEEEPIVPSVYKTVKTVFPHVRAYKNWVPDFNDEWCFVIGSKGEDPAALSAEAVAERLRERGVNGLKMYSPEIHEFLFRLPKYFLDLLEGPARIVTDKEPVFVYS